MERYILRHPRGRTRVGEDERPIGQILETTPERNTDMRPINGRRGSICSCGKTCKNERGLKIHRTKMGCAPILNLAQRTEQSGETEEEEVPGNNHSNHSLHAPEGGEEQGGEVDSQRESAEDQIGQGEERRKRVKWPGSFNTVVWQQFDEDVDNILEAMLAGNIDRKVKGMATCIYSMGIERFGTEEKEIRGGNNRENRREKEIGNIRRELRALKKQFREASDVQKQPIIELTHGLRERLKTLRRAETNRRNRKERSRKRTSFVTNPFQFVKKLFGSKGSGKLVSSKEEVEEHLRKTHSDPRRAEDLAENTKIREVEEPTEAFDESEPKLSEVREIIKKARAGSAPGPNGVPYRVYKNCPRLLRRLWLLLRKVWRRGRLAESWNKAEGCFIPKEDNSKDISQFRTISLLNVEGKVMLAVLARRLTKYMLDNKYIDISVQKGGIPGVSGCLEHTSVLTQIIREARENKGNVAVLWLDLANAYGSIPHKLVEMTMEKYHVPEKFRILLKDYFDSFQMRFTVGDYTTAWQRLEVGIVTGCTISVILFAAAMNLIIKAVEKMSRGPYLSAGSRQPPTRAFMDDMTVTTKTVVEGRWTLRDLEEQITWARMRFKPAKSRSLVLKAGKVKEERFQIGGVDIPTVTEKPVKSLGKWFNGSLNDKNSVVEMKKQAEEWMKAVEKSGLPGKFKAWIYQHGVLPRLLWPLLVYEVPLTSVEAMERMISGHLRRWLNIPRSFSSVGLYSSGTKLQLPLKSLTEEFKVTKVRQVIMLRDSADDKVREARVVTRTGRKWDAKQALKEAEARLRHGDIVGSVASGRLGLGTITRPRWGSANQRTRRDMAQAEIRSMDEEARQVKAVSMRQQGSWTHWEGVRQRKVSWNDIWKMEGHRLSFLLKSTYDLLPSPTNLFTWGIKDNAECVLCRKPANLAHVLTSCQVALSDGRYTWRHDQVLKEVAASLDRARRKKADDIERAKVCHICEVGNPGYRKRRGWWDTRNSKRLGNEGRHPAEDGFPSRGGFNTTPPRCCVVVPQL
ncbi:uncharacterized protein [Argopecten irradians]|uniref:uncharacterized protein n=1 Tax=Argopecten irradians TaxID=31199 RepID=UPI0037110B74